MADPDLWIPNGDEIKKVIKNAPKSAPGPGGIPFTAFKNSAGPSALVLKWMLQHMFFVGGGALPPGFNHAWLAMLPQKAGQQHQG